MSKSVGTQCYQYGELAARAAEGRHLIKDENVAQLAYEAPPTYHTTHYCCCCCDSPYRSSSRSQKSDNVVTCLVIGLIIAVAAATRAAYKTITTSEDVSRAEDLRREGAVCADMYSDPSAARTIFSKGREVYQIINNERKAAYRAQVICVIAFIAIVAAMAAGLAAMSNSDWDFETANFFWCKNLGIPALSLLAVDLLYYWISQIRFSRKAGELDDHARAIRAELNKVRTEEQLQLQVRSAVAAVPVTVVLPANGAYAQQGGGADVVQQVEGQSTLSNTTAASAPNA